MGVVIVEVEGTDLGVNVERPIITSGDFVAHIVVRERRTLPEVLWGGLVIIRSEK